MSEALAGRLAIKARQVRPGTAAAVEVKADQLVQVTDVQGKQVADFVAFALDNRAEFHSVGHTRATNGNLIPQKGHVLYSNLRRPMFEIVDDTVGRHDMLFAACDPVRYEMLGAPGHANCRTALFEALRPYAVGYDDVPDPINWFMYVAIKQRGELELREPISEKNDYVLLKALIDSVVAVSACPQDLAPVNSMNPTDILVRVYK